MRILVLTAAFPSRSDPGRGVFVAHQVDALAALGHELAVVAPRVFRDDPLRASTSRWTLRRFPYPGGGRILKEVRDPGPFLLGGYLGAAFLAALEEGRRHRAEALLAHWALPAGPAAALAAKRLGIPLYLVVHGGDLKGEASQGAAASRLLRWTLGRALRVLAVSAELRELAVARGADPARTELLPMGAGPAFEQPPGWREARAACGLASDRPLILHVGDQSFAKGADLLVGLGRRFRGRAELVAVGRGPWAGRLATAGWRLAGSRRNSEVARWMAAADLLVLPSRSEGAPVTLMEAARAGLPAVASDVGAVRELLGPGGLTVPPGSIPHLVAAVRQLMDDPALRSGFGSAQLARREDYTAASSARRLAALLDPPEAADRYWLSPDRGARDRRARERARIVIGLLPERPGRLLDVGCGPGVAAAAFREAGWEVRGVEGSPMAVEEARRRGVDASVLDLDGGELPPGPYDAISCLEVLEHLDRPAAVLARMKGRLAPGGSLLLSLPNEDHLLRRMGLPRRGGLGLPDPSHKHLFDLQDARGFLEGAGLRVLRQVPVPLAPEGPLIPGALRRASAALAPAALSIATVFDCRAE